MDVRDSNVAVRSWADWKQKKIHKREQTVLVTPVDSLGTPGGVLGSELLHSLHKPYSHGGPPRAF
jgi:hypothetical protein